MKKDSDLYALFQHNPQAKKYFDKLPDYIREQISTRASGVDSFEDLRNYAENLLRGDG